MGSDQTGNRLSSDALQTAGFSDQPVRGQKLLRVSQFTGTFADQRRCKKVPFN